MKRNRWMRVGLAIVIGLVCGLIAFQAALWLRPHVAGLSAQEALWRFYRWAGWWWWGIMIGLAATGLVLMFTLSSARTRWGRVTRGFLFAGFVCHVASWGNNGLGPLGNLCVMIGVVLLIAQLSRACAIERRKTNPNYVSFAHRALTMLVNDKEVAG